MQNHEGLNSLDFLIMMQTLIKWISLFLVLNVLEEQFMRSEEILGSTYSKKMMIDMMLLIVQYNLIIVSILAN